MGRRVHLFYIRDRKDLSKFRTLLKRHNKQYTDLDDQYIRFNCFIQYDDEVYIECVSYTSDGPSEAFWEKHLKTRYFPPFVKPEWFNEDTVHDVIVSPLGLSNHFDEIVSSFETV